MTHSENGFIFIITDLNYFYLIKEKNEISIKEYQINVDELNNNKNQIKEKETKIWCDKYGTHVILKLNNIPYYFNSQKKHSKINVLQIYDDYNLSYNEYLQPYAIAFNDDFYDFNDTGNILLADFNSDIYELRIKVEEFLQMTPIKEEEFLQITPIITKIFSFRIKRYKTICDNYDDIDIFKYNYSEKILDMKIIFSIDNNSNINKINIDSKKKKNILILAITQNRLFQFYGRDSFKEVFKNYSLENELICKSYKLFVSNYSNFNQSRIQLINKYFSSNKEELIFSCMFPCGFCIGKLDNFLVQFQ